MTHPSGRWAPPLLIIAAGAAMLAWSWGTWPDPIIDFGRELYVPWQLAQGKVLYRDIAYFNGPLSPYLNSLWFRCFGATLRTLVLCNLAIAAAITAMIYTLFKRLADHWAATGAALAFLLLFAFSRYEWVGNSNYICPYSHETTHGIALSLAMLLLLDRYLRGSRMALALSGFLLGLIFLTKVEIFVAAALAAVTAVICRVPPPGVAACLPVPSTHETQRSSGISGVKGTGRQAATPGGGTRIGAAHACCINLLLLLVSAMAAPSLAWAALSLAMPARDALLGTLGSWHYTFNTRLSTLLYFKIGTGLLDPLTSIGHLVLATVGIGVALLVIGAVAWRWNSDPRRGAFLPLSARLASLPASERDEAEASLMTMMAANNNRKEVPLAVGHAVLLGTLSLLLWRVIPWLEIPRPLPLAVLAIGVMAAVRWRHAANVDSRTRAGLLLISSTFALAMLLKMILHARLSNYGYFLAMPATLLSIAALLTWIPEWLCRRNKGSIIFRTGAIGLLLAFTAWHLSLTAFHFRELTVKVASGADAFYAGGRGAQVNEAVRLLDTHLTPAQTIAVMPEGAMINFLTHRANPTPYIIFMPSDLIMFGEDHVIAAMNAHPPDYILLAHKDTSEYGYRFFGQDYAQTLMDWVHKNYMPAGIVGAEPFHDEKFGILIVKHRDTK